MREPTVAPCRTTITLLVFLAALAVPSGPADAQDASAPVDELARAVEAVEGLDDLRERLATSFLQEGGIEPDATTFREVCRPVGQRARSLAREHGWTVQQLAVRYRNPDHRPDEEARWAHERMEERTDLDGLWLRTTDGEGRPGIRYFRRITVRKACLECHGPKADRPSFVKERYPEDRAYGFEVGDLRGVYSVFVPTGGGDGAASDGPASESEG